MGVSRDNPEYKTYICLLATNQRRIYGFIYAMVPNHSISDDIMQETTLRMWEHFDKFQEGTNFAAWGIRIARNLVMQYYQKQKRKGLTFDIEALENLIDQSDVFESKDDQIEALRGCYKKLKDHERKLLEMRYIQGDSIRKIAEHVNLTTSHLYRVIARIHNVLLKCIKLRLAS